MEHKLDEIDKKLIYELGKNAKLTYKEIAKKIGSKTPVIAYRLQKLEKEGIIWKYVPIFSLSRLGIYAHKIYIKLHGLDKKEKESLVKDLVSNPRINWVAETIGSWDLLIGVYAENFIQFAQVKKDLFREYGKYFQDYAITLIEDALVFNRDYLTNSNITYRKEFIFGGEPKKEKITDIQKEIIRKIKNDGRYKLTELADNLKINVRTIISNIKDLEKRGIIQGHTAFLNLQKTDFKLIKICIYFQNHTEEKQNEFVQYCKQHPKVLHLIKSIGNWELEVEIETEKLLEAYSFIEEINTKFPNTVKKTDLIIFNSEVKLDFFPEWY